MCLDEVPVNRPCMQLFIGIPNEPDAHPIRPQFLHLLASKQQGFGLENKNIIGQYTVYINCFIQCLFLYLVSD